MMRAAQPLVPSRWDVNVGQGSEGLQEAAHLMAEREPMRRYGTLPKIRDITAPVAHQARQHRWASELGRVHTCITRLFGSSSGCSALAPVCQGWRAVRWLWGDVSDRSFADITEAERAESEAWWASVSSGRAEYELHRSPSGPQGYAPPQSPQAAARPTQQEAYDRRDSDASDRPPSHASVRSPPPPQTPPRALPQTPPRALQVATRHFQAA